MTGTKAGMTGRKAGMTGTKAGMTSDCRDRACPCPKQLSLLRTTIKVVPTINKELDSCFRRNDKKEGKNDKRL